MSELKIPDPIAQAAINVGTNGPVALVDRLTILKAVCRAISENPIAPTIEQMKCFSGLPVNHDKPHEDANYHHCFAAGVVMWPSVAAVEWQRRMFLAPDEPEASPAGRRVLDSIMGCTFTRAEADEIIDAINTSVAPVGSEDEAIRDLLSTDPAIDDFHGYQLNDRVREAYLRGRKDR